MPNGWKIEIKKQFPPSHERDATHESISRDHPSKAPAITWFSCQNANDTRSSFLELPMQLQSNTIKFAFFFETYITYL